MSKKNKKREEAGGVGKDGYSKPTRKDLNDKPAPRGRNRGRGR
jgi:hypothetical protein|tara:strand:- start:1049 stop:1177 length:129 start_codon:yes stop_codon:yes gene_type:complete